MSGYEVAKLDELERLPVDPDEGLVWRPVRRHFGIRAFGANAYTAAEAGDRVVEEHSETQNQHEELYFVAAGRAAFVLDGDEIDAPAGTFVHVAPQTRRGAVAREPGTTILAVGGRAGVPFAVSGWESAFAAYAYQRLGDSERALATMQEAVDREPGAWQGQYHLACLHMLAGNTEKALAHLRRAVEMEPQAAEWARDDEDFASIRDDPRFVSAVAGQADGPSA
jgi:tetratricopeptide (TPR) repeat protein